MLEKIKETFQRILYEINKSNNLLKMKIEFWRNDFLFILNL